MDRRTSALLILALALSPILAACSASEVSALSASGTLSALEVAIGPQIGGRVVEVEVDEGDVVQAGEVLFRVDDEAARAQREEARAAVAAADATLRAAQAQLAAAQSQRDLAVQASRLQDQQARRSAWNAAVPADYQPAWYFQKPEQIAAAEAEVSAAEAALGDEQTSLERELTDASSRDFRAAEGRLAQAQAGHAVADATLAQARQAGDTELTDAAEETLDAAESELEAARLGYERLLTSSAADAVLRARARVAVAQSRLDNARDVLASLQSGDQSLQVTAAEAAVGQAQAAVGQAQANLERAQAGLALLDLQLERTEVTAPLDGVVLSRNLEVGELVAAGGIVMTVARLEALDLIVYLPEDRYGQVEIGQQVRIEVDSYPGEVFGGSVIQIADEAEFTPRNVQTVDSRTSTVYAVRIRLPNPDWRLKPGMPADVSFSQPAS